MRRAPTSCRTCTGKAVLFPINAGSHSQCWRLVPHCGGMVLENCDDHKYAHARACLMSGRAPARPSTHFSLCKLAERATRASQLAGLACLWGAPFLPRHPFMRIDTHGVRSGAPTESWQPQTLKAVWYGPPTMPAAVSLFCGGQRGRQFATRRIVCSIPCYLGWLILAHRRRLRSKLRAGGRIDVKRTALLNRPAALLQCQTVMPVIR